MMSKECDFSDEDNYAREDEMIGDPEELISLQIIGGNPRRRHFN